MKYDDESSASSPDEAKAVEDATADGKDQHLEKEIHFQSSLKKFVSISIKSALYLLERLNYNVSPQKKDLQA